MWATVPTRRHHAKQGLWSPTRPYSYKHFVHVRPGKDWEKGAPPAQRPDPLRRTNQKARKPTGYGSLI
jgi:hypothetical protein